MPRPSCNTRPGRNPKQPTEDRGPAMTSRTPLRPYGYQIVHELPGRLRLRIPALGTPGVTPEDLEDWMDPLSVVVSVRANRGARTLILRYRDTPGARAVLLRRLGAFVPNEDPDGSAGEAREAEIAPLVTTALTIALLPLLSRPLQVAVTMANVASTLASGIETLITKGVKVEVLDAWRSVCRPRAVSSTPPTSRIFCSRSGTIWNDAPSINPTGCCVNCCAPSRQWPGSSVTAS